MKEEHRRFAEAILKLGRGGETVHTPASAYESVYPDVSHDSALRQSSLLLKNLEIAAYIQKRRDARHKRTEVTEERILKELAKMAFFNIGDVMEEDGSMRPISEIERDDMAAITGLDIMELQTKGNTKAVIKKIKTAKDNALDKLARHTGFYDRDNRQKTQPVNMTMNFAPPDDEEGD